MFCLMQKKIRILAKQPYRLYFLHRFSSVETGKLEKHKTRDGTKHVSDSTRVAFFDDSDPTQVSFILRENDFYTNHININDSARISSR